MAVLTTNQRDQVYRGFMRIGISGQPSAFVKTILRTAVDNADDWAESAGGSIPATSYNTALNVTFRTNATTEQKTLLLGLVAWVRAGMPFPQGD
jgi:hypothetical protein